MLNRTKEYLDLINEDALFPDDFDEALIGFVEGASRMPVALYDSDKCIRILIERDCMDLGEAEEFFYFNLVSSYMGENTPLFATLLNE